MREFIDLTGASGANYRFRLWQQGAPHSPMAGNYVFVKADAEGDGYSIVQAGVSDDLSTVRSVFEKAAKRGATHVFTRLNVSRAVRTAEHEDISAALGSKAS